MILDDEALVEHVARAIAMVDGDTDWKYYRPEALAAIEAVRVHMWDDGR